MKQITIAWALAAGIAGVAISGAASAQEWSLSGTAGTELRYFTQAPGFAGQSGDRLQGSLTFSARATYGWNGGDDQVVVAPFLRWGANGGQSHADLREAYWLHRGDGYSVTLGIDKLFWGVTESRNPVDIINQDDLLEGPTSGEKLGQPMANLTVFGDWGTLGFYVLPAFRARAFPDPSARFAGPLPIGAPVYSAPRGARNVDYALRWSNSLGDWDLGLSYFRGTARAPVLIPTGGMLVPRYDQISQAGLDLQYTAGDWLWKLEAISRSGQGPRFAAFTAGVEKTIYGIGGGAADLTLLAEWNYDGRDALLAPPTIYDNDLFLGARLALNDIAGTSAQVGALIDRDTDARVFMAELQRRLGEQVLVKLSAGVFAGGGATDAIGILGKDDYISLSLTRSF